MAMCTSGYTRKPKRVRSIRYVRVLDIAVGLFSSLIFFAIHIQEPVNQSFHMYLKPFMKSSL